MPTSYELIWCDRAVADRIFLPTEAGNYSIATSGAHNTLPLGNPVSPFEVVSFSSDENPCTCVAQARRCSDDVKVALYVRDSDVDFNAVYLAGATGGVTACVYFDAGDERVLGCACATVGTPYTFNVFDGDCPACLDDNIDPDFYVHGFTCGDNPKPIDVWVKESDVTVDTQTYWHDDYGCIVFNGPPALDHGTLIDSDELTPQDDCDSCLTAHAYVRAFRCKTDIATGIFVPEGSVLTDGTKVYKISGSCYYFTPQTYSPPPVPPTSLAGATQFPSCDECHPAFVQGRDCDTDELIDLWVFSDFVGKGDKTQSAYQFDGVCVYFMEDDEATALPDGAYFTDDFSTVVTTKGCDDCTGKDCPTDNDPPHGGLINIGLESNGCDLTCGGEPQFPDGGFSLSPTGSGTWLYNVDEILIKITCSGKYWVLQLDTTYAFTTVIWRKLRVGGNPNSGQSRWDFVSEDGGCCTGHEPFADTL